MAALWCGGELMRDIFVLAIIFGSVPVCFINPYFGILMWNWVAVFNPHRFTYGFAYNFPVAYVVALPTMAGMLFTRKINRNIITRESVILILLWVWFAVTIFYASSVPIFSQHIDAGMAQLVRVSKVLLITFVTILLVTSRDRLRNLFLVLGLSIGVLAIKGALFGIRTGGENRVWGPPESFLADNNDLALATNMALPILFFLAAEEKRRWLKILLRLAFVCGIFSVLLSYSRGGLLGLVIVLCAIAATSRHKVLTASFVLVCAILVFSYAPGKWMERMGDFYHGDIDRSARGRLNAWEFAIVLSEHFPLTGGGFETFTPDLFQRYTPDLFFAGPHSIYFQTLGEQGFVGLALFLGLLGSCGLSLWRMARMSRYVPSLNWAGPYAYMLGTSLLAYMVSGAFLPRAYFDFFYTLVATVIIMNVICQKELRDLSVQRTFVEPEMNLAEVTVP
jgi:probable O-glycosylation ligase (exosortase A-associated)